MTSVDFTTSFLSFCSGCGLKEGHRPVCGEQPMDLSVTQRLLHPGPDLAMLASHPPLFLGHFTSQHCSQFSQQQHLQVGFPHLLNDGGTRHTQYLYTCSTLLQIYLVILIKYSTVDRTAYQNQNKQGP